MKVRTPLLTDLERMTHRHMEANAPGLEKSVPLPTMPYAPAYADWVDHLERCQPCAIEMTLMAGETAGLCIVGQAHQEELRWDIEAQRDLSVWN